MSSPECGYRADLAQAPRDNVEHHALADAARLVEADASSAIEGIELGVHQLAASGEQKERSADVDEGVRCEHAHKMVIDRFGKGRNPTTAIIKACSYLKGQPMPIRTGRCEIVSGGRIVYRPPVGRMRLEKLLEELWRFALPPSGVDPLVRMAAAHYQFESIHPFGDGNGRTGRMVNGAILAASDAKIWELLPLSRGIAEQREMYYRLLNTTRYDEVGGGMDTWITWMLGRVMATARWMLERIEALRTLTEEHTLRISRTLGGTVRDEVIRLAALHARCIPYDCPRLKVLGRSERGLLQLDLIAGTKFIRGYGSRARRRYVNSHATAVWERTTAPYARGW